MAKTAEHRQEQGSKSGVHAQSLSMQQGLQDGHSCPSWNWKNDRRGDPSCLCPREAELRQGDGLQGQTPILLDQREGMGVIELVHLLHTRKLFDGLERLPCRSAA